MAVIPACDEAELLSETLCSLAEISEISRIIVSDDGSLDATAEIARRLGVDVLAAASPGRPSGKGNAMLSGLSRARALRPDAVLLADADLGASAVRLSGLIEALGASHPAAIASFPPARGGGLGLVKRFARQAISHHTGYAPSESLSGQRALLSEALEMLPGIAPGFGAEVGMTLDLLAAGIQPEEIPLDLTHRPTGKTPAGFVHRTRQGRDILRALRGERLPW